MSNDNNLRIVDRIHPTDRIRLKQKPFTSSNDYDNQNNKTKDDNKFSSMYEKAISEEEKKEDFKRNTELLYEEFNKGLRR